jgi:hypothetical protein
MIEDYIDPQWWLTLKNKKISNCKHEDIKLVGAIANTQLCFKCGNNLVANEIEILNTYYEVGGFCDNEKCERYLLLVV